MNINRSDSDKGMKLVTADLQKNQTSNQEIFSNSSRTFSKTNDSKFPSRQNRFHYEKSQNAKMIDERLVRQHDSCRRDVGGKGMFLKHMKSHDIPVPEFRCITTQTINTIYDHPLTSATLLQWMPSTQNMKLTDPISINALKEQIQSLTEKEQRDQLLIELSHFIAGDAFYQLIKNHPSVQIMRNDFNELCQQKTDQAIIVRSSGVKEDCYGSAQAGKYESLVHNKEDFAQTCLTVMAQAFHPDVFNSDDSLSLVVQHYETCQFGGVVTSFSSLKDSTMQIEYVPNQPKGVVAGQYGITPHCYSASRQHGKWNFTHAAGNVFQTFQVQQQGNNSASEVLLPVDPEEAPKYLSEAVVRQLCEYIERLENLLNSPVDVEFGVNTKGDIVILQVRPVTRLQGDVQFSIAPPTEFIDTGTLISEGLCKGPLVKVKPGDVPPPLPEGAIIYAHHCEDWMLTPDTLTTVGGVIFDVGGKGDHAAITIRQAGIPCLIRNQDQATGSVTEQGDVTLVCGEFNGIAGAFLLNDSQYDALLSRRKPATGVDFSAAITRTNSWQPTQNNADRVDHQFLWLHQQNARSLAHFDREGLLAKCLSPSGSVLLSMSPQRVQVLRALRNEIAHLWVDSEALLQGYERYLLSGTAQGKTSSEIATALKELNTLKKHFEQAVQRAEQQLDEITEGLTSEEELLTTPRSFEQWRENCLTLQKSLQSLNLPKIAEEVHSIHDAIFFIHGRFIDRLGAVAIGSGQGEKIKVSRNISLIHFPTLGGGNFLDDELLKAIDGYGVESTVLNMDGAAIINTKLGYHRGVIELIEKGPANKGRLLKVRFTDDFRENVQHISGKFKRFLHFAEMLRSIASSDPSQRTNITINESVGEIVVEINNIASVEALRELFQQVASVLGRTAEQDNVFSLSATPGLASVHNFSQLREALDCSSTEDQEWLFKAWLFQASYSLFFERDKDKIRSLVEYNDKFQDISKFAQLVYERKHNGKELTLTASQFSQYEECIKLFLICEPEDARKLIKVYEGAKNDENPPLSLMPFIEAHTDWLTNKNSVLQLVTLNGRLLDFLSAEFKKDKEVVLKAVTHSPKVLKNADESLWSDSDILTAASESNPSEFASVAAGCGRSALLKLFSLPVGHPDINFNILIFSQARKYNKDKEMLLQMAKHDSECLEQASDELRNNDEFMQAAYDQNPGTVAFASERILSNKAFVMPALKDDYLVYGILPDSLKADQNIKQIYIGGLKGSVTQLENELKTAPERDHLWLNRKLRSLRRQLEEVS